VEMVAQQLHETLTSCSGGGHTWVFPARPLPVPGEGHRREGPARVVTSLAVTGSAGFQPASRCRSSPLVARRRRSLSS
jgi:hypothetical protein